MSGYRELLISHSFVRPIRPFSIGEIDRCPAHGAVIILKSSSFLYIKRSFDGRSVVFKHHHIHNNNVLLIFYFEVFIHLFDRRISSREEEYPWHLLSYIWFCDSSVQPRIYPIPSSWDWEYPVLRGRRCAWNSPSRHSLKETRGGLIEILILSRGKGGLGDRSVSSVS